VDVGLVDVALVDVGLVDVHQGAFRFLALDSYSRIKERNARDARDR